MFNYDAVIGNEAIDFQVDSKLGKTLTAIFQDVFDYKEKLDYSKIPNIDEDRRKYRISAVADYFIHKTIPRFRKAVLECCNLDIRDTKCYYGDLCGLRGTFGLDIRITDMDIETLWETLARISGDRSYQIRVSSFIGIPLAKIIRSGQTDEYIKDIMSISDVVDKSKSRLKSRVFGKSKRPLYVRLRFDINAAFLSDDFVSADVAEPITAPELAGLIMHEIGHAMTIFEHCGDLYFMKSRIDTFCTKVQTEKLTESDYKKLLSSIDKTLVQGTKEKLKNTADMDSTTKNMLTEKLDTISTAIRNINRDEGAESGTNFFADILRLAARLTSMLYDHIYMIVVICTTRCIGTICWIIQSLTTRMILTEVKNRMVGNRNGDGRKISDVGANRNRKTVIERWADEFVARQGYASYHASCLNKLHRICQYAWTIQNPFFFGSIRLKESKLVQALMTICLNIERVMRLTWFCDSPLYENEYRRLIRLAQDTYAFFKHDENVSREDINDWMQNVKQTEAEAEKAKRLIDTKPGQVFFNLVTSLTNPAKWFDYVNNGNLEGDLKLLEDNLDDMTNNKLFYLSDRLKFRQ